MRGSWGIHVCNCEGKLPVDAGRLATLTRMVDFGEHPRTSAEPLVRKAREAGVDRMLIACCQGPEAFGNVENPLQLPHVTVGVNHRARCFETTPDAAEANGKALRLLRGELRAAQYRETPEEAPLRSGKRVLLVTEVPAGLALAESLSASVQLTVVVSPDLNLPPDFPARRAHRGYLTQVRGRLGAFACGVSASRGGGNARDFEADQVLLLAEAPPVFKTRTGVHVFMNPSAADLAGIPQTLRDLSGDFMKPIAVRYDPNLCAGGAASKQGCGLCIPACPYEAIARDTANPLRIAVDQLACEACGACTAACPTSALEFTEPTVGQLLGRLAGLLGPDMGAPQAPFTALFHCSRQGRQALDAAAERTLPVSARLLPVEVPCLRHVSDALMLAAVRMGAAGVAVAGCEACPHGERELLHRNVDTVQRVMGAAGLGGDRIRLFPIADGAAQPEPAMAELNLFAEGIAPSPIRFEASRAAPAVHHELVADALRAFIGQLGPRAEPVEISPEAPYARASVRVEGCTLCRSCANACPSHAFRIDEAQQTLEFKQASCVACGLCEQVCPEKVITLHREISLTEPALEYQVLVRDEMISCKRCGKPYVNKRALDAVEAKVGQAVGLSGVFSGSRLGLLRMCPDCRAVAAMLDVRDGWQP